MSWAVAAAGMVYEAAKKVGSDFVEVSALMGPGAHLQRYKASVGNGDVMITMGAMIPGWNRRSDQAGAGKASLMTRSPPTGSRASRPAWIGSRVS